MENNTTIRYCQQLRKMCDLIEDDAKREIFRVTCKRFIDFKCGTAETKNVSKEEMMRNLIEKGYMSYKLDESTGLYTKLPDDRGLRRTIRELLTEGYPIITTSHDKGCFIVEDASELDGPQEENHSRAVAILAVDKGYNMVRQLLSGQQKFLS